MQKNKTGNMIIINNAESNIINDAVIYLKENVNIEKLTDKKENNDLKDYKFNVIAESEEIITSISKINDIKFEKYKIRKLLRKIRIQRIILLILLLLLIYFIKK